jgi:hypothetical protein
MRCSLGESRVGVQGMNAFCEFESWHEKAMGQRKQWKQAVPGGRLGASRRADLDDGLQREPPLRDLTCETFWPLEMEGDPSSKAGPLSANSFRPKFHPQSETKRAVRRGTSG